MGFAIAAPVGPIGMLCIQRALHQGFSAGLMTGVGASCADGVYGMIAGFGLTTISSFLLNEQSWIHWLGGLFLVYMGAKLLVVAHRQRAIQERKKKNLWHIYGTTFFLTLTNPMTILSFIAIFAGLGLGSAHPSYTQALALILGIMTGSFLWFSILSTVVAFTLHHRINANMMIWINRGSGIIILLFGVLAFFS